MKGAYLGPELSRDDGDRGVPAVSRARRTSGSSATSCCDASRGLLADEKVVGWFNGRMEFGPRALGARSILGDPRSPRMQAQMNIKIKFREGFRPFAPSVLARDACTSTSSSTATPRTCCSSRRSSRSARSR